MSLSALLIEHCSPTLASLKAGSLFSLPSSSLCQLEEEAQQLNTQFAPKGLALHLIRVDERHALCYLYRHAQLAAMLADKPCAAFLNTQGYDSLSVQDALDRLCSRLAQSPSFPHEVGLFLGYPLADVVAFIENKGKNCLCCGCWKAYTNACAARRLFAKFSKCTEVYKRLYHNGRTLCQLTVAV